MRTPKVQLQPIRSRILRPPHDVMPRLTPALHHQRSDNHMLRIPSLRLRNLLQVHLDRPVGDQLDIVESHHPLPRPVDRRVPRTHICNRLPNRLPHRSAPARIEGPHHLLTAVRRRCRSQPERIQHRNPAERRLKRRPNHSAPPAKPQSQAPPVSRPQPHPQLHAHHSCSRLQQKTSNAWSAP